MDLSLVMGYWGDGVQRAYHHTAPVNALYGLHESLVMLREEGLEAAWARHAKNHRALRAGLEAMGLSLLVREPHRLPQLNAVRVPDRIDEAKVRRHLLCKQGIEIGAGLGDLAGRVWRVGLMGQSSTRAHVMACLDGLEDALSAQGRNVRRGQGAAAAQDILANEDAASPDGGENPGTEDAPRQAAAGA